MTAWNHPIFIAVALVVGLTLSWWLFRHGARPGPPDFECEVCGRKQRGLTARQWRFCPFCGVARGWRSHLRR